MRRPLVGFGAAAAVLGGVLWIYKAGSIMITGAQPPWAYELAPICFAVGLVGLGSLLPRTRLARVGLVLAVVAGVSAILAMLGGAIRPDLEPREDTVTLLTPFIVLGGLGMFVALALLGSAAWRARVPPPPGHVLPLGLAIGIPLLLVIVVATGANDRVFELPILVGGLGWCALGVVLWGEYRAGERDATQAT